MSFTKRVFACLLVAILLVPMSAFATLDVRIVWEVNSGATAGNVNGGGFDPFLSVGNMLTDLACTAANTASPVCSSASYNFIAGDVGHWLFVSSGTSWTANSFCQIASVAANAATLTAGIGTCNVVPNAFVSRWSMNTTAGVASVASPTAGTFSVDRSRSTAAPNSCTATCTNTAGVITVGGLTYDKTWIGNVCMAPTTAGGATIGWYEITNSVLGVSFTLDRTTGGTVSTSLNCGGAISLGSSTTSRTDSTFFGLSGGTNGTGSAHIFYKSGNALGVAATTGTGGTQAPAILAGYQTVRDDGPTGANRPSLNVGANGLNFGTAWVMRDLSTTGTSVPAIQLATGGQVFNVKCVNTSATAAHSCFGGANNTQLINVEAVSYRGPAISTATTSTTIMGSWLHDSAEAFTATTGAVDVLINNIIEGCTVACIQLTGAFTSRLWAQNNTFYGGAPTLAGTNQLAFSLATGTTSISLQNNIISGFATGVTHADTQYAGYDQYNDYFGNTSDVSAVTQWQKGATDVTTNPSFTSVATLTGTTATTTAGNHLVDSAAHFQTGSIPVVAGRDYVWIVSGTGITAGVYGIASVDSDTQITADITLAANATADKVYRINVGHNFLPTGSIPGFPGAFPGGFTTGSQTIGGAQSGGGSGGHIIGGDESAIWKPLVFGAGSHD